MMSLHAVVRMAEHALKADKSAPTGGWMILLTCIIALLRPFRISPQVEACSKGFV
jgi:hypothetical protein